MSVFAEDLRTYITGSTAVSSLISTRCHYAQLPQSSIYPHIWFRVTSDTVDRTMDGVGLMHEAYIDVEAAGVTPGSAQSVADALFARLDGYKGSVGNATAHAIFLSNKDDDYIPFSNLSDEGVHVCVYTAHAWYTT